MRPPHPRLSRFALLPLLPLACVAPGCADARGFDAGEHAGEVAQALEGGKDRVALRRSTGRNNQYAYAPSIVKSGGRFYLYMCNADGVSHGDAISLVTSDDGVSWSAPTTVLDMPSEFAPILEHTCDPSVVLFQAPGDARPYYHLYFSTLEIDGTDAAPGTVNAVARSESLEGPFHFYVGGDPKDPASWVEKSALAGRRPAFVTRPEQPCGSVNQPSGGIDQPTVQRCYGVGQPSVVARDGTLYMWYFDSTAGEWNADHTAGSLQGLFFTTSEDGVNWSPKQRVDLNVGSTRIPYVDSVDVKYHDGLGLFVMVDVVDEHHSSSKLFVRTSEDGVTWSSFGQDVSLPPFSHNGGVSGDERGHVHDGKPLFGFGGSYLHTGSEAPLHGTTQDRPDESVACSTDQDCGAPASFPNGACRQGVCRDVWTNWDLYVRELETADFSRTCEEVSRVAGPSRFDTSLSLAGALYPNAETVVLVNGEHNDTPDALAAGPLASRLGAPIVTVPRMALPEATHDYLVAARQRGLTRALLVGGTGAISPTVEGQVAATGLAVERLAGADRYETAARIADRIEALKESEGKGSEYIAFVASGETLVDALATGPVASLLRAPIVLVREKSVPEATKQVLEARNLHRLYLVGGEKAVSEAVRMELDIDENDRISGPSRYDTAVELAEFAREWGMSADTVWIARADRTADAVAVGGTARLIVLSDTEQLTGPTRDFLAVRSNQAVLLGGHRALSVRTEEETCVALGQVAEGLDPFAPAASPSTFAKSTPGDEGGCAVAPGHSQRPALLAALSALALSALARRRGLRGASRVSPLRRA